MKVIRPQERSTNANEAVVFTALLLAGTLVLLVSAFGLSASSGTVPRAVGIPLAVLIGYRLQRDLIARKASPEMDPEAQPAQKPDAMGAILWLLALPAVSTILGFVAGPALYVFVWARYRAGERIAVAVAAATLTAAAIWLLFARLLGTPLWQGLLGALV